MGALTLVTLFVKMLKFFLNINFKENNIVKENKESFEIFIYLFIYLLQQMGEKNPMQKGNVNTLVFQACPIVLIVIVHLGCIIIISYYLCSQPPFPQTHYDFIQLKPELDCVGMELN